MKNRTTVYVCSKCNEDWPEREVPGTALRGLDDHCHTPIEINIAGDIIPLRQDFADKEKRQQQISKAVSEYGRDAVKLCDGKPIELMWAIVCTDKRGVICGLIDATIFAEADTKPEKCPREVKMYHSRMAVYWSKATKGVWSLAEKGPQDGSRISGAVAEALVPEVHAIYSCEPKAVERWEEEPWSE